MSSMTQEEINVGLFDRMKELEAELAAQVLDNEKSSSALRQATQQLGALETLRAQLAQQKMLTAGQQKRADKLGREFDLLQKDWLKSVEERDALRAQLDGSIFARDEQAKQIMQMSDEGERLRAQLAGKDAEIERLKMERSQVLEAQRLGLQAKERQMVLPPENLAVLLGIDSKEAWDEGCPRLAFRSYMIAAGCYQGYIERGGTPIENDCAKPERFHGTGGGR